MFADAVAEVASVLVVDRAEDMNSFDPGSHTQDTQTTNNTDEPNRAFIQKEGREGQHNTTPTHSEHTANTPNQGSEERCRLLSGL